MVFDMKTEKTGLAGGRDPLASAQPALGGGDGKEELGKASGSGTSRRIRPVTV